MPSACRLITRSLLLNAVAFASFNHCSCQPSSFHVTKPMWVHYAAAVLPLTSLCSLQIKEWRGSEYESHLILTTINPILRKSHPHEPIPRKLRPWRHHPSTSFLFQMILYTSETWQLFRYFAKRYIHPSVSLLLKPETSRCACTVHLKTPVDTQSLLVHLSSVAFRRCGFRHATKMSVLIIWQHPCSCFDTADFVVVLVPCHSLFCYALGDSCKAVVVKQQHGCNVDNSATTLQFRRLVNLHWTTHKPGQFAERSARLVRSKCEFFKLAVHELSSPQFWLWVGLSVNCPLSIKIQSFGTLDGCSLACSCQHIAQQLMLIQCLAYWGASSSNAIAVKVSSNCW